MHRGYDVLFAALHIIQLSLIDSSVWYSRLCMFLHTASNQNGVVGGLSTEQQMRPGLKTYADNT